MGMSSEGNGLEERGAGRFFHAVCWGVVFFNRAELKGRTGHCSKENNKIEIKLLGRHQTSTQFRDNVFLTPKQKGWLNLGICSLFLGIKYWSLWVHTATLWKGQVYLGISLFVYMLVVDLIWKGILQTGNMKIPHVTWIVIWYLHVYFCSMRESLCQAYHWHLQRWKTVSM